MNWRDLLRRRQGEEDLTDELRSHLELQTQKHLAAGLDPECDDPDPQPASTIQHVTATAVRSTIAPRCRGFSAAAGDVGDTLAPIRS